MSTVLGASASDGESRRYSLRRSASKAQEARPRANACRFACRGLGADGRASELKSTCAKTAVKKEDSGRDRDIRDRRLRRPHRTLPIEVFCENTVYTLL